MTWKRDGQPDLVNVPRFVEHLKAIDREAAALVSQMLNDGWDVTSCWGPEQMDVWELKLVKGSWQAVTGMERGYAGSLTAWQENHDGERTETLNWHSGRVFRRLLNQRVVEP